MSEANNSQKPDGQDPVSEKTGDQQSVSEKSKSEGRLFTGEKVGFYTLLVGGITFIATVLGILISILISIISQIDATRAEVVAVRAEISDVRSEISDIRSEISDVKDDTLEGIQSLGNSLRAGIRSDFTRIDWRVISNDERIDSLYDRELELSQEKDDEDEERDQEIESLGNRVSSLEEAQESEG